jgi:hypothetical protein
MSMADNSRKRPDFLTDSFTPKAKDPAGDPLAELARLIGQSDPFAEPARKPVVDTFRAADRPAPEWLARPAAAPDHDDHDYQPRPAQQNYAPQDDYAPHHDEQAGHGEEPYAPMPSQDYRPLANVFAAEGRPEGRHDGRHEQAERHQHAAPELPDPQYDGYEAQSYQGDDRYRVAPPPAGDYEADSYYAEDGHMPPQGEEGRASGGSRRGGLITIAAVFGLAIIGTAGAFGYRAFTNGTTGSVNPPVIKADTTPAKIVAAPVAANADAAGKPFQDRVGVPGGERLVSREEQPIPLQTAPARAAVVAPPQQAAPAAPAPFASAPALSPEPKRVKTLSIRPDAADGAAAFPPPPAATAPAARAAPSKQQGQPSGAAPMQLAPQTDPSARTKTASRTPAPTAGAYMVQITSQTTEAEALAAYRSLQTKYPSVLGGREPVIRRAELNSGTRYRAQVGPFASMSAAEEFCGRIKAADGQCLTTRN